jgi:hypothetical protein
MAEGNGSITVAQAKDRLWKVYQRAKLEVFGDARRAPLDTQVAQLIAMLDDENAHHLAALTGSLTSEDIRDFVRIITKLMKRAETLPEGVWTNLGMMFMGLASQLGANMGDTSTTPESDAH